MIKKLDNVLIFNSFHPLQDIFKKSKSKKNYFDELNFKFEQKKIKDEKQKKFRYIITITIPDNWKIEFSNTSNTYYYYTFLDNEGMYRGYLREIKLFSTDSENLENIKEELLHNYYKFKIHLYQRFFIEKKENEYFVYDCKRIKYKKLFFFEKITCRKKLKLRGNKEKVNKFMKKYPNYMKPSSYWDIK